MSKFHEYILHYVHVVLCQKVLISLFQKSLHVTWFLYGLGMGNSMYYEPMI